MSIRTTLTLDEDVVERVKAESRARGISFKQAVNDIIREGLLSKQSREVCKPFNITPRPMGKLNPALNFDCIGELLEELEGPNHR